MARRTGLEARLNRGLLQINAALLVLPARRSSRPRRLLSVRAIGV